MGSMQFRVPHPDQYDPMIWNSAYISGIEGVPWAGRVSMREDGFALQRSIEESGRLSIVWPNREYGASVLSTASLRCQNEAYWLPVELARGTLHRIRQRAFEWQRMGLKIPEAYGQLIEAAVRQFIDAILANGHSPEEACHHAQASIESTLAASRPLCRAFVSQIIQFRLQQDKQLSTLLGIRLGSGAHWKADATMARKAMNTAIVHPAWHLVEADASRIDYEFFDEQIAWAKEENLRVASGPLVSLQPHAIQNWMYMLGNFDSLYQAACQYVQKTVERFRGRIQIWNVAAGLNCPNDLSLTDEQVLQLAVGIIQAARRADPKTPVTITIDMPWAEYLGQRENSISPIHFADALLRSDLGVSGIALDMNLNYWPSGSLPRDLIDVSDLIDQWSILGIPLVIGLSAPSNLQADPLTTAKSSIVSHWRQPENLNGTYDKSAADATYILEVIQMLLAKQNVHGIFWNQLSDRDPHPYPNSGLIDSQGQVRPILDGIVQLRTRYGQ
jgi:hypothetical protein